MCLLEIDGGPAEFAQRLAELCFGVTFTDLSPNSLAHAKRQEFEGIRIDFNHGVSEIGDSSFDAAVMLEVIEHIVNAECLLAEVRRVLKAECLLVISTPNFAWWVNRLRVLSGWVSLDEGCN